MKKNNETSVMFSGGLDSLTTVVLLSEIYQKLHLLTFCNGYGHWFVNWSKKNKQNLDRIIGSDRYVHIIQDASELFKKLLIKTLPSDYNKYKSRFIWCMACKLAMHTLTIRYCLEHGLAHASDGSSLETNYYVEQMEGSLKAIKDYYAEFGIDFSTPIHKLNSRAEEKKLLTEKGIQKVGLNIAGRNPGTQPLCVTGNFIYFFSTFLKIHPKYDQNRVLDFIEEKKKIAITYMKEHFESKGKNLEQLMQNLKGSDE